MDEGLITAKDHSRYWLLVVRVIAIFWILAGLGFLGFGFLATTQTSVPQSDFSGAGPLMLIFGTVMASAGAGLLTKKRWGKGLGILGAVASLLALPVGTILGILVMVGLRKNQAVYGASKFNQ